jgi:hypothetical protein
MSRQDLAALACWIAALAALAIILRAGHPLQAHLVHSDALYLPVLFDDLAHNGGRIADWFLTPAPYFFPDMPLYGLAWLAGGGVSGQAIAFALLQTALGACALYLLARQALSHGRLPAAAALSVLFIWLGLHTDDPFVRLFASAHHYGAFIASLLLCRLWLSQDAGPDRRRLPYGVAALVALTFLMTLSDALFLAHTVLPLLAMAWLFRHGAPPATRPRRALLLLLGPALAGMLAYRHVVAHPTRYPTRLGVSRLADNLGEMGNIAAALFGGRPLLAAAVLLSLALGAACLLACRHRRPLPGLPRPLQLLAAFATLSFLATVGAMLLSKNIQPVPRYLIGALSWPLVSGVFALVHLLGERARHAGAALSLALSLLASVLLVGEAWPMRAADGTGHYYYPEQVACIDSALAQAGARHGMAQYWDAKRLQALSRQRLTLAQYTGELERMEWITSEHFYRSTYDFAIVAEQEPAPFKLSRARLAALGGEPLKTVACGDRTVLLYGTGRLPAPRSGSD